MGQPSMSFLSSSFLSLLLLALPEQLSGSAGLPHHRDLEREFRLASGSGLCCAQYVCLELQEVPKRQTQALPSPEPWCRQGAQDNVDSKQFRSTRALFRVKLCKMVSERICGQLKRKLS